MYAGRKALAFASKCAVCPLGKKPATSCYLHRNYESPMSNSYGRTQQVGA